MDTGVHTHTCAGFICLHRCMKELVAGRDTYNTASSIICVCRLCSVSALPWSENEWTTNDMQLQIWLLTQEVVLGLITVWNPLYSKIKMLGLDKPVWLDTCWSTNQTPQKDSGRYINMSSSEEFNLTERMISHSNNCKLINTFHKQLGVLLEMLSRCFWDSTLLLAFCCWNKQIHSLEQILKTLHYKWKLFVSNPPPNRLPRTVHAHSQTLTNSCVAVPANDTSKRVSCGLWNLSVSSLGSHRPATSESVYWCWFLWWRWHLEENCWHLISQTRSPNTSLRLIQKPLIYFGFLTCFLIGRCVGWKGWSASYPKHTW